MAATRFDFQVVALDKFTATFRKLNNEASRAARPLVNTTRQIGALGRELHLDKVEKGITGVANASATMARNLGLSIGPLESILGAGGIVGGVIAAGGAAIAIGANFARTGFEVARASQAIGIGTNDLQHFQAAAKMSGLEADSMTGALKNLGNTLQDAQFGRNPVALQVLDVLTNGKGAPTGPNRVAETMKIIADAMQKIGNPQTREVLAEVFGVQDVLPLLMQGSQAIQSLGNRAEQLGAIQGESAIKWSQDFTASLNDLQTQIQGLANTWGQVLVPTLTRGIDALSKDLGIRGTLGLINNLSGGGMFASLNPVGAGVGALAGLLAPGSKPTQHLPNASTGILTVPGGPGDLSTSGATNLFGLNPEEQARSDAYERSSANRDDLREAIANMSTPKTSAEARGQDDLRRFQVQIELGNAPPGTTATTRDSAGGFVPTLIGHSFPGSGP